MKKAAGFLFVLVILLVTACTGPDKREEEHDPDGDVSFIEELIASMSTEEKIGQMLQAEEKHITPEEVQTYNIGSILSGGGSHPYDYDDDVDVWFEMVKTYQEAALQSDSGIPLLYGIDAVHGHNNVYGATIFPHNINLGMMNEAALMERIGEATTLEMQATGIHWNFAPAVSVARDIRWGRTYESFGEDPSIHENLVEAYIRGLQSHEGIATAKHFVADGGTEGGKDQGDARLSEEKIRAIHLPPFLQAIDAGVDTIMVSFSSIEGVKMHASHYWLTTVLKEELGFAGLVLSDWNATFQLDGDFRTQLVSAVNAGVDMLMLPYDWKDAHYALLDAVDRGLITQERIDDAVRRILTVKYENGLFAEPLRRVDPKEHFATDAHKALAREAARKSFVLLENDDVLPLTGTEKIHVMGPAADHVGYLAGGWTTHWQGNPDPRLGTGRSILEAIAKRLAEEEGRLVNSIEAADTVLVVFTELPYAEGYGDTDQPTLFDGLAHPENIDAYDEALRAEALGKTVIGVIVSGRPLVLPDSMNAFDALIAVFLPGTEGGNALSDVLYGDHGFSGRLSFTWPASLAYFDNPEDHILYPFGYGLEYEE